ncbi:MAG: hypothetical protein K0B11_13230 [Mariniphaga sp.]|nr:hypothetical protein [Mariniphaga sp.]
MIDYIKIHELLVKANKILKDDRLTFPLSNVATTGEIMNRSQVAHWQELQFVVRGEKVSLKGSLHKHFEGGTNYRDFHLTDIKSTIEKLSETFQFDPQQAIINFLEVGVNIPLENDPTELIKTLVRYKHKPFESLCIKRKTKGFGRVCRTSQFDIKVYNKSLQYGLNEPLMRYEVKIRKMELLAPDRGKKKPDKFIFTLADLTKLETYQPLKKMLLDIWQGILLFDPEINPESIQNPKDRELFISGRYPEFWQELPKATKNRKLKRFNELAGGEKIKHELKQSIERKWNQLTTFRNEVTKQKPEPIDHFQEPVKNDKTEPIDPTINGYLVPTCIVTGLEIKYPAKGKKILKHPDIKFYYERDRETYSEKLESLLTDKWKRKHEAEPLKNWFVAIAHKIRCAKSNPRRNPINNARRSYRNIEAKGLKFWPTKELADPAKLELICN